MECKDFHYQTFLYFKWWKWCTLGFIMNGKYLISDAHVHVVVIVIVTFTDALITLSFTEQSNLMFSDAQASGIFWFYRCLSIKAINKLVRALLEGSLIVCWAMFFRQFLQSLTCYNWYKLLSLTSYYFNNGTDWFSGLDLVLNDILHNEIHQEMMFLWNFQLFRH